MLLLCFSNVTIMSYITIVTNVSVVNKKKKKKKKKKFDFYDIKS